ncbi:MAG: FAD-dependent oxidoreductase [Dehalococcoidia bacterium]
MAYDHVFQPITVNKTVFRNRVVRSAHGTGLGGGQVNDDLIAYHEARARGGVAMSILEASPIHPSSGFGGVNAWLDSMIPGYQRLADAAHRHGMVMMQQLMHQGAHATPTDGGPPWAPSAIPSVRQLRPSEGQGDIPIAMTQAMIDEIVDAYAAAAVRAQEGGLDGVEVHLAHTFLPMQFLSPTMNRRTDGYGGSTENRRRFMKEVLAAIRARVRPDFIIGVRLTGREGVPGGIEPDECRDIALDLEATGLVDLFSLSTGGYLAFDKLIGAMHEPHAYELPDSGPASRALKTPHFVVGRILTLAEADAIIARGDADMVSMIRATLADPDIVRKTQEGRADDVRPCLGCNQGCIGGRTGPLGRFGCVVNVGAGQELRGGDHLINLVAESKRVFVVGGGPAGLEAARVAALRGHQVTLFEAASELGGQVRLARKAPHRDEFGADVDWIVPQLRKLEVQVRLNTKVDRALIEAEKPDAVILATGSTPRRDGFQAHRPASPVEGIDRPNVFTSWEVIEGGATVGKTAVVFDDIGHYEAIAVAETLLSRGVAVIFATPHTSVGPQMVGAMSRDPALRRLTDHASGFTLVPRAHVTTVRDGAVVIQNIDSGRDHVFAADSVVFVSGNVANTALAEALAGYEGEVHVAGDARAPRPMEKAIHEGHYAALRVGTASTTTAPTGGRGPLNPLSGA